MGADKPEEWKKMSNMDDLFNDRRAPIERPIHAEVDPNASTEDFSLPPEKEAYYAGAEKAEEHQRAMEGMSVKERNEYVRALREGLRGPRPKAGDIDNPLKKDMPREPRAPRQPNPMAAARKLRQLANRAKGGKHRQRRSW